jgi:hypothetical protein
MKKISTIKLYLSPTRLRSFDILGCHQSTFLIERGVRSDPAILAIPIFVLSIRLHVYRSPRTVTTGYRGGQHLFCSGMSKEYEQNG